MPMMTVATSAWMQTTPWKSHLWVRLLFIALLSGFLLPSQTGAHASLVSTTPGDGDHLEASPIEIVLEFSEPVGVVEGGTVLHSSQGESTPLSPANRGSSIVIVLDDPLQNDTYVLQWRVISADAHPIAGTVTFTVGELEVADVKFLVPDVPRWVEWSRTGAVALKYFGLMSALGILIVGWRLVSTDVTPAVSLARRFVLVASVGIVLEVPLAAMVQQGDAILNLSELWTAINNLDMVSRIGSAIGLLACVVFILAGKRVQSWLPLIAILSIAVLSFILSGHTQSRDPRWLMLSADATHVLSASFWLGGIVILTLGLRNSWRGEGFGTPERSFRAVSHFSALAGFGSVIVIASGAIMAVTTLDSIEALYKTDYGITLLVKTALVTQVVALAALNRFWLIPGKNPTSESSMSWLRKLVTIELALLIIVALVTGSLVHRDPIIQEEVIAASLPSIVVFEDEVALDSEHSVRLQVSSTPTNQTTITATIVDQNRNIVIPDANMEISWYLPDQNLGPLNQILVMDSSTGAYFGTYSLPKSGEWEMEVRVNIDRFTDSRTTVQVSIP